MTGVIALLVGGTASAQVSGTPGDGIPDVYYFPADGLTVNTSVGVVGRPGGTLLLDTDGVDVVVILVAGPNGIPGCDLCDGGFLPDPNNPPFFASNWTMGFAAGSTQWVRTNPFIGPGYVGVVGEDDDPNNLGFPDHGLTNYGPGLSDADFPGSFDGGRSVLIASDSGAHVTTNVTVVSVCGDSDGDGVCDDVDPCEGADNVDAD
ncbi:MAG: hypothetical protein ACYTGC_17300, partial [Planctomycetota bacterium]